MTYKPEIVLITGATGDFGKAFAKRFAAIGCHLVLHGRDTGKLETFAKTLDTPCHLISFDMTDGPAMKDAVAALPEEFKNIDVLVNNAGLALGLEAAPKADIDDWDTMIDVNVKSLARMTRLILEGMTERKKGHIINIGSIAGTYPYPGGNAYCATKAFVKQFSLALRADLAGTNVRVTNIEPGMVETQFSLVRFKGDKTKADAVYAGANALTADDIAESVFWAATLPPHVNINRVEIMPTSQSFASLNTYRQTS